MRPHATRALRLALAVFAFGAAASAWAGDAWRAEYRVGDGRDARTLVVVRDEERVEYREGDGPVRVWRRTADGLEHREIFAADRHVVEFAPGDLRAIGWTPDWAALRGLIDPALRPQLKATGTTRVFGERGTRYAGTDAQRRRVALDWLDDAGLPARYRVGRGKGMDALTLTALQRVPAVQAFTRSDGYREVDYADLGDMELDPFARRYLQAHGGHVH